LLLLFRKQGLESALGPPEFRFRSGRVNGSEKLRDLRMLGWKPADQVLAEAASIPGMEQLLEGGSRETKTAGARR
jgi:hypothetical protein